MRKLQFWSTMKEVTSVIDGWDDETFKNEMAKSEMKFVKYLPSSCNWEKMEKYVVTIKLTKEEVHEKE